MPPSELPWKWPLMIGGPMCAAAAMLLASLAPAQDRLSPKDRSAWIRSVNSCLDEGHVLYRGGEKGGDGWACIPPDNFAINYCVTLRKTLVGPIKPVDDRTIFAEWCLRIWEGLPKSNRK